MVGVVVFAPIAGTGCFRQAAGAATGEALGVAVEDALELGEADGLELGVAEAVAVGLGDATTEPGPKPKKESCEPRAKTKTTAEAIIAMRLSRLRRSSLLLCNCCFASNAFKRACAAAERFDLVLFDAKIPPKISLEDFT